MANGMKKLLNIVAKLEVGKGRRNSFGNYDFRNAEDILTALKPLMVEYGVFVGIEDDIELIGERYYVKSTVSAFDAETGDLIKSFHNYAREALNKKGMDDAQVTGAASSYARKYALAGMFNLSPAPDPDEAEPDEAEPEPERKKTVQNKDCTIEQYLNIIGNHGIDAKDFTQQLFHKEIGQLDQKQINNTVYRFQDALRGYYSIINKKQAQK